MEKLQVKKEKVTPSLTRSGKKKKNTEFDNVILNDLGVENLCNAIITQAAQDFKDTYFDSQASKKRTDTLKFFNSEDYMNMTNLSASYILNKIIDDLHDTRDSINNELFQVDMEYLKKQFKNDMSHLRHKPKIKFYTFIIKYGKKEYAIWFKTNKELHTYDQCYDEFNRIYHKQIGQKYLSAKPFDLDLFDKTNRWSEISKIQAQKYLQMEVRKIHRYQCRSVAGHLIQHNQKEKKYYEK